jgi:PAS domain S-box-containing protein
VKNPTLTFAIANNYVITSANVAALEVSRINSAVENNFKKLCEYYQWNELLKHIQEIIVGDCDVSDVVVDAEGSKGYVWKLYFLTQADEQRVLFAVGKKQQYHESLRHKLENLQYVINNVPLHLFWKDRDSVFLGCNQHFANSAGLKSPEEIVGKTDYDLPWKPEESAAYIADDQAVMQSNIPKLNIEETQTINGEKITLLTSKVPLINDRGEVSGVIAIYSDISDRKRAEQELAIAKELAEVANEAKSNFLAVMSHELRTPLNGIIGLVQIMGKQNLPASTQEYVTDIENSANHLLNLVNDILDFSRLEINAPSIHEDTINIEKILKDVFSACKERAKAKQLQMTLSYDDNIPEYIVGDSFRIKQIMFNLIDNAIKYTKKGSIEINMHLQGTDICFVVKDSGIGIAGNMQDLIFDKFFQVESGYIRSTNGLGLGLAICRKIVTQMHGEIGVESRIGEGSRFWFSIPCIASAKNDIPVDNQNDCDAKSSFSAVVLVVEDNKLNQKVAKLLLEELGCFVYVAENGAEALKLINERIYGVVFMDLGLPDIDGYKVTKKIRALYPDLPIIGLTAHADKSDIEKCYAVKMNDVLTKPVVRDDFRRVLTKVL